MRWLVLVALMLSGPASAQDRAQSLADVKAELAALAAEFNSLRQELITTGAAVSGSAGADPLARMDAMEAAIARLTSQTEAVGLRLGQVVTDGTNRIGDLEYRLCEMTEGCDPANLPATPELGGNGLATDTVDPAAEPTDPVVTEDAPEMAVNEQADFDRAQGVLTSGDFRTAADLFATYAQTYPGGALTQQAGVLRGDALTGLGDTAPAARSYLDAFSGAPDGAHAGEALTKLGQSLGRLSQTPEACATLAEVGKRFPDSADATNAAVAMQGLGCT